MLAKIENVTKIIEKKVIIDNISFTLHEGEIVALVGPNGAGKTTLLGSITNILKINSGTIIINGIDMKKNPDKALEHISFMQDNSTLYPHISGYQHLKFVAKLKGKNPHHLDSIIKKLKIQKYINDKVSSYSLGMKQHLLFAIALIAEPKLLIMDEPLNGLDPTGSLLVRELILDLKSKGTTILFSSHLLDEIDKISDRLIFIKDGKVVATKDLKELGGDKTKTYILKVKEIKKAMDILNNIDEVMKVDAIGPDTLQIEFSNCEISKIIQICAINGVDILDIEKRTIQTELAYHHLIGANHE
ncbi:ABC transporter ATP-binding protein [Sutcliffiella horikoshii]|uniref:ABC transporter ATP-binding protein n=1 Tax=Sutcliffiella horikoshii TaxID=79883 RepID=UPI00203E8C9F|nr:ABC transporter ATP-binding protein [Sutcliffiella horikoshii]MCM3618506.1 ABC transporter ATP-binding protein [Sutcliffiella horikoshii]